MSSKEMTAGRGLAPGGTAVSVGEVSIFGHGLGTRANVKFFVDASDVGVDGGDADIEAIGDFLVEVTAGEQFEDFLFARGQLVVAGGGGGGGLAERLDDFTGDVAGHGRASAVHVFEGREEFLSRSLFQQVASGTGGEGAVDVIGVLVDGEHDELGVGKCGFEAFDSFDSAHAGQIDVHEDDVGLFIGQEANGAFGVTPFAGEAEARGTRDPSRQDFACLGVVLDDGDCDGHVRVTGSFACGLVLLAAWGIPALLATHGQFFVVGIGRHVIERSFGILDSHGLSGVLGYLALLPFYLLTFFFSFFPWALKFPAALRSWWPRRLSDDLGWYLLAQATVVFATFSLVRTRLPHYTLPAFPCLALWLALQLDHPAATAQIFRSVGAMILLTLLLTLGAAPFASRHIVTAQLARQLRPVLKPRSQVAVLGLSEPSLVWELRGLTTNFLSYFPVARLSSEFQRQPPWCIILPTDTLQSHTDLIPTNATLIRAVGVETAGFHRWDLTAVILP